MIAKKKAAKKPAKRKPAKKKPAKKKAAKKPAKKKAVKKKAKKKPAKKKAVKRKAKKKPAKRKAAKKKAMAYSDKLYSLVPQVKPVDVGRFAGVLDYNKLSFFFRLIFKVMLSILGVQEGDYRDWEAIRAWAKETQLKLNLAPK